jgi:UDP-glucose 4-epimerase
MILIIGGNGFLGRHLCRMLCSRGLAAVVVTRTRSDLAFAGDDSGIGCIDAKVFQTGRGDDLLASARVIIYLASQSVPATFRDEPWREIPANVEPAWQFFERCARLNPAARIILVSSGGTVYGRTSGDPVGEDTPLRPISGYGLGKVMIEQALAFVGRTHAVPYAILRVSNPIGRWQTATTQGIVPIALRAARDHAPIPLYGYGLQVRDYLDADDVARAILTSCSAEGHLAATWNVGSGVGRSVLEMIRLIERVTGVSVPVRHCPPRPIDVPSIVLDCTRIRTDLGWVPQRPLEASIADIWQAIHAPGDSSAAVEARRSQLYG